MKWKEKITELNPSLIIVDREKDGLRCHKREKEANNSRYYWKVFSFDKHGSFEQLCAI